MKNSIDESATPPDVETASRETSSPTSLRQPKANLLQQQKAVLAMGRRAVAKPDISILMQDAAALLAETLGAEYSIVAEFLLDGESLQVTLSKTALGTSGTQADKSETDGKEQISIVHKTPADGESSLASYVLKIALPLVVADLPREDRFSDLFLRKHGIQSAVAVPLKLNDRSFGSLAACSTKAQQFGEEDVLFVETIAHLVTASIARGEAERSLVEERCNASKVFQAVDAIVLVLNPKWEILRINPACERITGFSLPEIKNRPIWNVLPVSEEMDLFRNLKEKIKRSSQPIEYESYLLTKHSQRRLVAWSYSATFGSGGEVETIIATGTDITDQHEATEKAARAEKVAEESQLAVARLMGYDVEKLREQQTTDAFGRMPVPLNAERRTSPRRAYPYQQRIAPIIGKAMPAQEKFFEVDCNDISASGFSFACTTPPACDALVVELGVPPKLHYMTAEITHITRSEGDVRGAFLVGCRYTGRTMS